MKNMNALDEKFKKDNLKFNQIKNENLVCKDCIFRLDDTDIPCNTSMCKMFEVKPDEVLDGGECIEYKN